MTNTLLHKVCCNLRQTYCMFLTFLVSVCIVTALSACYQSLLCRSLLAELARHVCAVSYQCSIDFCMMDALCVTLTILLYTDLMFNTISAS
jgi:hypothetical protein